MRALKTPAGTPVLKKHVAPRVPFRGWLFGTSMGGLLALLMLLVFGDVRRRNSEAILDFAVEQEAIASGLAMGLSARLDRVRDAVLWAAGRASCQTPWTPQPSDPFFALQVADQPPVNREPREGQVALSVALDEKRRAYFLLSLSRLRSDLRQMDRPGDVRMLLLPPLSQQFQTLNGRQVSSDLLLQGLRSPSHHIRIPKEIAAELRLPARDALAGLAEVDAGDMGIWAVAVVATARRALDREAQASWRSILAILCAAGLVLLLMMGLQFVQRRELQIEKALEVEAAHRKREEELERANRAATLGALAMGIAHEMSTPLGVIATRAEQLASFASNHDLIKKSAQVIGEQTLRMERVIRGILAMVRGQNPSQSTFSATTIGEHAALLVAHRFAAADVELQLHKANDLPDLRGDQHLLEQALVNLLLNACDASAAQGVVELRVTANGNWAEFAVMDKGIGITEEEARHAMEPFYTTKPEGRGSGLGLAIAQEIVKAHRGSLTLMPRDGGGTTACLRIPIPKGVI